MKNITKECTKTQILLNALEKNINDFSDTVQDYQIEYFEFLKEHFNYQIEEITCSNKKLQNAIITLNKSILENPKKPRRTLKKINWTIDKEELTK